MASFFDSIRNFFRRKPRRESVSTLNPTGNDLVVEHAVVPSSSLLRQQAREPEFSVEQRTALFNKVIKLQQRRDKQGRVRLVNEAEMAHVTKLVNALSVNATTDTEASLQLAYLYARCPVWGGIANPERAVDIYTKLLETGRLTHQAYLEQLRRINLTDSQILDFVSRLVSPNSKPELYFAMFQSEIIDKQTLKNKLRKRIVTKYSAKVIEISQNCETTSPELAAELYNFILSTFPNAYKNKKLNRTSYLDGLKQLAPKLPNEVFTIYLDLADEVGGYDLVVKPMNELFYLISSANKQKLIELHSVNNNDESVTYYHNLSIYLTALELEKHVVDHFDADAFIGAYIRFEYLQQQQFCMQGQGYQQQLQWLDKKLTAENAVMVANTFVENYFCDSEKRESNRLAALFYRIAFTKNPNRHDFDELAKSYQVLASKPKTPPPVKPRPGKKTSPRSKKKLPVVAPKPQVNQKLSRILNTLRTASTAGDFLTAQHRRVTREVTAALARQSVLVRPLNTQPMPIKSATGIKCH